MKFKFKMHLLINIYYLNSKFNFKIEFQNWIPKLNFRTEFQNWISEFNSRIQFQNSIPEFDFKIQYQNQISETTKFKSKNAPVTVISYYYRLRNSQLLSQTDPTKQSQPRGSWISMDRKQLTQSTDSVNYIITCFTKIKSLLFSKFINKSKIN